jgi:hypothetical protein
MEKQVVYNHLIDECISLADHQQNADATL